MTLVETRRRPVADLMSLRDRVAVVTGGAGHIGMAVCETLAELGAHVAVLDRDEAATAAVADRLRGAHDVDARPLAIDLANERQVRSARSMLEEAFGRLDVLVNCAAMVGTSDVKGWAVAFQDQSADTWRAALEINLTAPFVLVQACAPLLAQRGHGSVINIGSTYGLVGPDMRLYEGTSMGNPAAYAASKAGLLQLTRWLATTLAPAVRVNAISPGGVWRGQPESFHTRYVERTPLRRMAVEEDLKGAVAYLASDLSAYMTGQNLVVDGGWTTW